MRSIKLKTSLLIIPLTLIFISFVECSPKLYNTGKTFMASKNYEDAILQFTKVIEEQPEYYKAYISRAEAYEKTKEIKKAADDYKRASAHKSKDENIYFKAGKLYYQLEDYDKAIQMLSSATSLNKEMSKAFRLKMMAYIKLEKYNKALFESNALLEIKETTQNHYWHGFIAEKLGIYNLAENDFKKAITLNAKDLKSQIALADVLFKAKKFDETITVCNKTIKSNSKCLDAYWIRSKTYKEKFDYSKAIDDLSKIIVLDKDNERAYFTRGSYYQEFNQHQSAINDFSKVISLNKNNALAYYNRAKSNEEITHYLKAISDYKTYISFAKNCLSVTYPVYLRTHVYHLNKIIYYE
jgi:tetratricopeptide (TPR) repeat protein